MTFREFITGRWFKRAAHILFPAIGFIEKSQQDAAAYSRISTLAQRRLENVTQDAHAKMTDEIFNQNFGHFDTASTRDASGRFISRKAAKTKAVHDALRGGV